MEKGSDYSVHNGELGQNGSIQFIAPLTITERNGGPHTLAVRYSHAELSTVGFEKECAGWCMQSVRS